MSQDQGKYNSNTTVEEHLQRFAVHAVDYVEADEQKQASYIRLVRDLIALNYNCKIPFRALAKLFTEATGKTWHYTSVQKAVQTLTRKESDKYE